MKALKSIIVIILLYIVSFQLAAQQESIHYNNQITKKLTFQIEIVQKDELPKQIIDLFDNHSQQELNNHHHYLLGNFRNEIIAADYVQLLNQLDYNKAEVVAFFRHKKIGMNDALTLANNYNRYDEVNYSMANTSEPGQNENLAELK